MEVSQCPRCKTRLRGKIARCPFDGEVLNTLEDPLLGRTIAGRYIIEERLGTGGMGSVYRGRHQVIDRNVALKFLHARFSHDPKQRKRFLGEARAANQINHEHVIDVTDFGETQDGLVYLVMEYLQGRPLSSEIEGRPMAPHRALRITQQLAMGLGRAHELDVVHRDVKPANVYLLSGRREPDFVKLLDFGIAHFERDLRITDRGAIVGTPEYMSPEQLHNGEVGPSSDLYAVGCLCYEMLTGSPPFTGATSAVLLKQISHAPRPPRELVPSLPVAVNEVVLKLLGKDPGQRHRDAFHLLDDIEGLQQLPGLAPPEIRRSSVSSSQHVIRVAAERPTVHVPNEDEEWQRRLEAYERLLTSATVPPGKRRELEECLGRAERALGKLLQVRLELNGLATSATSQADAAQSWRSSIGHALDELAKDESKVARRLQGLREQGTALGSEIDSLVEQAASHGRKTKAIPGEGNVVSRSQARTLERIQADLQALARSMSARDELQRVIDKRHSEHDDLLFQISQLKGRLATANAATQVDMDASGDRANELESDRRDLLDSLVEEATRLADGLRHHPEFGRVFRG